MKCKDIIGGIITFAIIIGAAFFITWAMKTGGDRIRAHEQLINRSIGKTIVIENDTLLIVNYLDGGFGNPKGFVLSNGVIIDDKIVKSYEIH